MREKLKWSCRVEWLRQTVAAGRGKPFFIQIFGGFFGPFLAKSDGMKI